MNSELTFAVDQNGHRAVVDQLDVHHGLEFACGNGELSRTQFSHDAFVELTGPIGRRRCVERGPPAFSNVAVESELRDDKHAAADVEYRSVHIATAIAFE